MHNAYVAEIKKLNSQHRVHPIYLNGYLTFLISKSVMHNLM